MIELVEATNSQGAILGLPLYDVANGYVVEEIEGLDPVKATIVSSSFAQLDGTQYQSSRRDARNIKLKIGLEPDFTVDTVRSLRKRLYAYFMPKSEVSLRLTDSDGLKVDISGRVESCDAPLFTNEPTMDVSIICFNPDFVEDAVKQISGNTTALTDKVAITYDGTVESGILFTLNLNRTLDTFSIYHEAPDGTLNQLDFAISPSMVAGDVLKISTIPGAKAVTLTHLGSDGSALYGMSPQSNWISLQSGINNIRVYAVGAAIPFTIEYTNKYGGL